MGAHLSTALSLSTGSLQGCELSPLLYTLYTPDCTPTHSSNSTVKFVDDTTVGLFTVGGESEYRDEVEKLSSWCSNNNLVLNTTNTKEVIVDFRRNRSDPQPIYINGECVERVSVFKSLGLQLNEDQTWKTNITAETPLGAL